MSRQRSQNNKAKPAGRSAPPARGSGPARPAARGVVVPQAQSDIYTALLGVSLFACLVGCGLLAFIWQNYYGFAMKP